jgi:hypothetical protein
MTTPRNGINFTNTISDDEAPDDMFLDDLEDLQVVDALTGLWESAPEVGWPLPPLLKDRPIPPFEEVEGTKPSSGR